jgi:hypothetical protein
LDQESIDFGAYVVEFVQRRLDVMRDIVEEFSDLVVIVRGKVGKQSAGYSASYLEPKWHLLTSFDGRAVAESRKCLCCSYFFQFLLGRR